MRKRFYFKYTVALFASFLILLLVLDFLSQQNVGKFQKVPIRQKNDLKLEKRIMEAVQTNTQNPKDSKPSQRLNEPSKHDTQETKVSSNETKKTSTKKIPSDEIPTNNQKTNQLSETKEHQQFDSKQKQELKPQSGNKKQKIKILQNEEHQLTEKQKKSLDLQKEEILWPQQGEIYHIYTADSPYLVLEKKKWNNDDHSLILQFWKNTPSQQFYFKKVHNNSYHIINVENNGYMKKSQRTIGSTGASKVEISEGESKLWELVPARSNMKNSFYLKWQNDLFLDDIEGYAAPGAQTSFYTFIGNQNQVWIVRKNQEYLTKEQNHPLKLQQRAAELFIKVMSSPYSLNEYISYEQLRVEAKKKQIPLPKWMLKPKISDHRNFQMPQEHISQKLNSIYKNKIKNNQPNLNSLQKHQENQKSPTQKQKQNENQNHQENFHQQQDKLHTQQDNLHTLQDNLHKEQDKIQSQKDNLHQQQDDLHTLQDNFHILQDDFHTQQDSLHNKQNNIPADKNNLLNQQIQQDNPYIQQDDPRAQTQGEKTFDELQNMQKYRKNQGNQPKLNPKILTIQCAKTYTVAYIWFGEKAMPQQYEMLLRKCKNNTRLLTEHDFYNYLYEWNAISPYYIKQTQYPIRQKINLLKLLYLYFQSGIYADFDTQINEDCFENVYADEIIWTNRIDQRINRPYFLSFDKFMIPEENFMFIRTKRHPQVERMIQQEIGEHDQSKGDRWRECKYRQCLIVQCQRHYRDNTYLKGYD